MCKYIIRAARPEDAPAMAAVHIDTWRTTYVGIVPEGHLQSLSLDRDATRRAARLADPGPGAVSLVAESDDGRIVGFADAGRERGETEGFDGEVYAVYVLKAWQGKRMGRSLMASAARALAEAGISAVCARVLADNRACGFYERLGGVQVGAGTVEIGGKELATVTYGWTDTRTLTGHTSADGDEGPPRPPPAAPSPPARAARRGDRRSGPPGRTGPRSRRRRRR